MARCARIVLPGLPMHIVQRGNNRQSCFGQDTDYRYFLRCLSDYLPDSGCAIHAYALMTNHIHLLLTPTALDSVFALMKPACQKYSQYFNRKYQRIGALWQGRYRSSVVETERYLLLCHRYIELNPVRAGIVSRPDSYDWSSYRTNASGAESTLLTPHPTYLALAATGSERLAAYRSLFDSELNDDQLYSIRAATSGNGVLGGTNFTEQIFAASGRRPNRRRGTRESC